MNYFCDIISKNWIYILSVALQLSGAIVVLIFNIRVSRDSILKSFKASSVISMEGNSKEVRNVAPAIKERFGVAYTNVNAFVQLAAGYLVGVFANKTDDNCVIFICVLFMTVILILLSWLVISLLLKQEKVTQNMTSEEMKRLGIRADIESMSVQDVDDITK